MKKNLISIVIPSMDSTSKENLDNLLKDVYSQNMEGEIEICRTFNISPSGRARNDGAEKAKGDILIFIDNDMRLGHNKVLKNMVKPLIEDKKIGICGVSLLIPKYSNWFQHRCAKEISHTEHPIVDETKELEVVGCGCCAIRRDVFYEVGEFNDTLIRGLDGELCHRIKKHGYRIVLVPKTWVYHAPPKNMFELIKLSFRNGRATAFLDRNYPELNFDIEEDITTSSLERKSKLYRLWRFVRNVAGAIIFIEPINLLSRIVYSIGYFYEVISKINR